MNLRLSEDLVLRTTRDLGDFATDEPLPHRWGDLTAARFPLLKLSSDRWLAADHPMEITSVFVDDVETDGWDAVVESDDVGHSWQIVRLATPAADGSVASACGRGKRDPNTGLLIENPADVLEDVLRIAGRPQKYPQLRAECAAAGYRIADSLDVVRSVQANLNRIAGAIGAIWTPDMARLYPVTTVAPPVLDLDRVDAHSMKVSASIADCYDVLRIAYDFEEASGRPQKSMTLEASPKRLGGVTKDMALPALRLSGNAEHVGARLLSRGAGERYSVEATIERTDIRPGRWIRLLDNPEWPFDGPDPVIMVLGVTLAANAKSTTITGEHLRSAPTITVTSHTIAQPSTKGASLNIVYRDGVLTLVVNDQNGLPVKAARVALDGSAARTTDGAGRVVFNTSRGQHVIAVEAPGFQAEEYEVEL